MASDAQGTILLTPQGEWTYQGIEAVMARLASDDLGVESIYQRYGIRGVMNATLGLPDLAALPPGCSPAVMWWAERLSESIPEEARKHPRWLEIVGRALESDTGSRGELQRRERFFLSVLGEFDSAVEHVATRHGLAAQHQALQVGADLSPPDSDDSLVSRMEAVLKAIAQCPSRDMDEWAVPGGEPEALAASVKAITAAVDLLLESAQRRKQGPAALAGELARLAGAAVDRVIEAGIGHRFATQVRIDALGCLPESERHTKQEANEALKALEDKIKRYGGTREQRCAALLAVAYGGSLNAKPIERESLRQKYGIRISNLVDAVTQRDALPRKDSPESLMLHAAYWATQPPAAKSVMCAILDLDLACASPQPLAFPSDSADLRKALVGHLEGADMPALWMDTAKRAAGLKGKKRKAKGISP